MSGRVEDGELVTVVPVTPDGFGIKVGDVVLCRVRGRYYLHLVKAFRGGELGDEVLIGNNHGFINGWTKRKNVYGLLTKVEP